jgi:hypothetical protein
MNFRALRGATHFASRNSLTKGLGIQSPHRGSITDILARAYTIPTFKDTPPDKIAVIGSGSFGTAAAITIARNAAKYDFAETEVKVFVHDEDIIVGDGVITYPHTAKVRYNDSWVKVAVLNPAKVLLAALLHGRGNVTQPLAVLLHSLLY